MSELNLVIFSPKVGVKSETFIKRHIEMLGPGKTAVITHEIIKTGVWGVPEGLPLYKTKTSDSLLARGCRYLGRRLTLDSTEYIDSSGIKNFLKDCAPAVIMGQYLNHSWPLIKIANEIGMKFYAHAHGYDLSHLFRMPVWRRRYADYRNASGVIVVNKVMKERMASVGVPYENIHIIPCGVDIPSAPVMHERGRSVHCLAVGRMVAKKAPLMLMEAFRLATKKTPDISLDYVGDGELFADVQRFVEFHDLGDRVNLHGEKEHREVLKLMEKSDIFLQHSVVDPITGDEEGLPVAILEAMSHALPVVSTRHAGIPEAVADGQTGFLVNEGDVEGMACCVLKLAKRADLCAEMGRNGWTVVQDKFSSEQEKSQLLRVMGLN